MTPEQLNEIEKLAEAQEFLRVGAYALPLVKALREAREAVDERECDMHDRIRAGYDKTVADMWRAHCAKIEKERDEARAEVARLKESVANLDKLYVSRTDELRESEAEVARLRGIMQWVFEEGTQSTHKISFECLDAVEAALKEGDR